MCFDNVATSNGVIDKVKVSAKPVGSIGAPMFIGDFDVMPPNKMQDTGSFTFDPKLGIDYKSVGDVTSSNDISNYFDYNEYKLNTNANSNIKYSYDGLVWYKTILSGGTTFNNNNTTNLYSSGGNCVAWNGSMWLVGGSNSGAEQPTIRYSYDGIVWSNNGFTGVGIGNYSVQRLVYFNNSVWVCGGQFSDCNLKYSYDGFSWSNCVYPFGVGFIATIANKNCRLLIVTPTYVFAAFDRNLGIARSSDGINFTALTLRAQTNDYGMYFGDGVFDGNSVFAPSISYNGGATPTWDVGYGGFGTTWGQVGVNPNSLFVTPLRHLAGGVDTYYNSIGQRLQPFYDENHQWSGERMPFAARANIIPTMKMSNLEIYVDTYINIYKSTNNIIG